MKDLFIDIETFSEIDITDCGSYRYTQDPSFRVLLIAFAVNQNPVQCIDLASGDGDAEFKAMLLDPEYRLHAHNANFERNALNKHFGADIPINRWYCTMALSARSGLPLGLGQVAEALHLTTEKMSEGKRLIKYFCMPCAPTKVNGGRTLNEPHHNPEKWAQFKHYCITDVEVEREIYYTLHYGNPDTPTEREVYILDQRINDRGVLIDRNMATGAVAIDGEISEGLKARVRDITGLDNPKSDAQLKKWVSYKWGKPIASLAKGALPTLIEECTDPTILEVLRARQELGKTSTTKYTKMLDVMGEDDRAHGLIQYYGANRTGRFAGRLVQVQNLPRNYIDGEVMTELRKIVRDGDTDGLLMQFDNVPDTLSQLIRTAFIAPEGKTFAIVDYAQIEARVIAWVAGEQWRIDAFNNGEDIYITSAAMMFGIPKESIPKGSDLRSKGKVAELACIAENELVLTDSRGLIPIQNVLKSDLVWDGLEWVKHSGVVYKGHKKVIEYDGLRATEDHLVWIEGQSEPIHFGVAAASGARLTQSGHCGKNIRVGDDNKLGEEVGQFVESVLRTSEVQWLRRRTLDFIRQFDTWYFERLPKLFAAQAVNTELDRETLNSSKTEVCEPERSELPKLRRPWRRVQFSDRARGHQVCSGYSGDSRPKDGNRPDRQQRTLREGQPQMGNPKTELFQQTDNGSCALRRERMAVLESGGSQETLAGYEPGANNSGCETRSTREKKELARYFGEVATYDILNAGPRHRFTVSGRLVHNCGYGGGVGAIKAFAKPKDFLTTEQLGSENFEQLFDSQLQDIITKWRTASPRIVKLWKSIENAFHTALETLKPQIVKIPNNRKHLIFRYESNSLTIELPSGRKLFYREPSFTTNRFGNNSVQYMGMNQTTKQWQQVETYGGKLTENIIQAIARDLLCDVMLRVDSTYPIVMHVHDELIAEVPDTTAQDAYNWICDVMAEPISWAAGLPTKGDGFLTKYYKKD